jgi:hypothetical protein
MMRLPLSRALTLGSHSTPSFRSVAQGRLSPALPHAFGMTRFLRLDFFETPLREFGLDYGDCC